MKFKRIIKNQANAKYKQQKGDKQEQENDKDN